MKKKMTIVTLLSLMFSYQVAGDIKTAKQLIPSAELVGKARLEFLFWDVYEASLYAPDGIWDESRPFALSLHYLMKLDGNDVVEQSIKEIRKQGFNDEQTLNAWSRAMREIFPDIEKNMRLTGVVDKSGKTQFFKNDQLIGHIDDPEFSQQFFNIWLGEKTTRPKLRTRLLGSVTQ